MKIIKGAIKEDFNRDLYWARIVFLCNDETKKTSVLVCASEEYLMDLYKLAGTKKLGQEHFNKWLDIVIAKWSELNDKLFEKDVHYDVYANTQEGEANGIDYLLAKNN